MTVNNLYALAARLLGEEPDTPDTVDLRRRAPALLTAVCQGYREGDRLYRAATGLDGSLWDGALLSAEDDFPLAPRFSPAAAPALAAALIAGENRELAAALADAAEREYRRIFDVLPAVIGPTVQRYGK